jgi:hypothetical protein
VISGEQDIGAEIGKIITMEALKAWTKETKH